MLKKKILKKCCNKLINWSVMIYGTTGGELKDHAGWLSLSLNLFLPPLFISTSCDICMRLIAYIKRIE